MEATRKVYIVGAGPGDPELLTLKGARLLESADLVLYAGSLVNEKILSFCREGCEIMNTAEMTLEEQVEAMSGAVGSGGTVVRLHTGDPSLYGAISEQIRGLDERNIDFEIVPGVSSLQGAAARLGVEYTVPGGTQTLICTRMAGRTPVPEAEDIESLAAHGATLAVFLSADMCGELARKCVAAGMSPDSKAAWVYRATWEDERVCVTTLKDLPRSVSDAGITKHALIVVGECLDRDASARSLLYDGGFSHGWRE
ncbi:MAG: precorrin-4 C(11)-methyltransferase [Synergistaceae bacterium]|nr:precorrin-4 C(11)-methyltransferase [Synergistaceae bacterium]